MKGLIFNLAQEVIEELLGDDAWDDVVRQASVGGAYTALADYPDDEFDRLVIAVSGSIGTTRADALRLVGRHALTHLVGRGEVDLGAFATWDEFLADAGDDLHETGRQVYHGAQFPDLRGSRGEDGVVRLEYRSSRRLCELAAGLVLGVGDWYGVELRVEQTACVEHGDPSCLIEAVEA